jgi:adenine specific DNA methylase Mod
MNSIFFGDCRDTMRALVVCRLDPFMGSGTTAEVAIKHDRQYLGCELNPEYKTLQDERIRKAII